MYIIALQLHLMGMHALKYPESMYEHRHLHIVPKSHMDIQHFCRSTTSSNF